MLIHAAIMALMQLSVHLIRTEDQVSVPLIRAEDKAAGGHACAGRDKHRAVTRNLVDRGAAHLPDGLGDAVHAMQVTLPELAAVRVQRERAAQLDSTVR